MNSSMPLPDVYVATWKFSLFLFVQQLGVVLLLLAVEQQPVVVPPVDLPSSAERTAVSMP